jgi:hypothetical protein
MSCRLLLGGSVYEVQPSAGSDAMNKLEPGLYEISTNIDGATT